MRSGELTEDVVSAEDADRGITQEAPCGPALTRCWRRVVWAPWCVLSGALTLAARCSGAAEAGNAFRFRLFALKTPLWR